MKVYKDIEEFKGATNAVVTTGTFDGVHHGHMQILKRLKDVARQIKGETVLLTFFPHPRMVLFPDDNDLKQLSTQKEKIRLLETAGIDHLIIQPFTKEFSRLSSLEFVRNILVSKLGTKKLVIGYDHRFGRNREGSFEHLKEFGPMYGFDVEEIPAKDIDHLTVSSTKIRQALAEGDVQKANSFLGYNYTLSGHVVEGKKLGRTIGFPTANIEIEESYKLIPANGVYAVIVKVNSGIYKGMLNIGTRPTIGGKNKTIEVNIFDFNNDIYSEEIALEFVEKLRDEQKFESVDALKDQLANDKLKTLKILHV